jgi:hypothetical protein
VQEFVQEKFKKREQKLFLKALIAIVELELFAFYHGAKNHITKIISNLLFIMQSIPVILIFCGKRRMN